MTRARQAVPVARVPKAVLVARVPWAARVGLAVLVPKAALVALVALAVLVPKAVLGAGGAGADGGAGGAGAVGGAGGAGGGTAGCPDDVFLDVAAFQGPGAAYPAPSLAVNCTETEMTVTANGIPHYTYVSTTPNPLEAQNHSWTVPLSPTLSDSTTEIPLLGTVAFAINGIPVYGPNEGPMPDPFGDPVANDVADESQGHTGGNADYHYHMFVERTFSDDDGDGVPDLYDVEPLEEAGGPSPILGFALDGFPIYGPRGCLDAACTDIAVFQSSWETTNYEAGSVGCRLGSACARLMSMFARTRLSTVLSQRPVSSKTTRDNHEYRAQDGENWLDECNGRIGPDGTYRYHATNTFPYILGCYRGVIDVQNTMPGGGGGQMPGEGGGQMGGMGRMPPAAAIDACVGLNENANCTFETANGTINGTCRTPPGGDDLACVPAR